LRALVIGASGQVGAALSARLAERGHTTVGTHHGVAQPGTRPLDIADLAATARLIDEVRPDWVFCPAGLTHVDHCEDQPDQAFSANRDAPAAAAAAAARQGAGFVYYSTEYVFDGVGGPYGEEHETKPLSVYGRSKLEGERAVCAANARSIVVRTTVVYGPEPQGKNFVYQLLRRAQAGEPMRAPSDQRSSPTFNVDLAAASVELAERELLGVVHVAGPEIMDRHAFARLVCDVFGLDASRLTPATTAELGQRAARPLDAGLRVDRARGLLTTPLRGPAQGLSVMRAMIERSGVRPA
jgi:dTDP-4-dehydrorhamnose reductase